MITFVLWKYILKYLVAKGHDICNSDGLGKQCIYRKREKEADFYHLVNLDRRWKSFLCYSCNFSLKFEVDSKFELTENDKKYGTQLNFIDNLKDRE